ncbi:HEPN domain-containing protein [Desulfonema magnum]|uniref:HEPN domain-containing protein n=1 Tax=Desulfonema magnum TaxID=45655 RepID=A0A975BJ62_9BACT|nr:HEPN domain-containing protein [Desulfonema magnum]QTA86301.1 HEPN domain-containing protein [Desulfonema magnum]
MTHSQDDLIRYRPDRAKEALEEAQVMANTDHWKTCINRLYYACFYAVSALLLKNGFSLSKHTGVQAYFNREFVVTGIIPKEYGRLYNLLFKHRQQSDYEDFFSVDEDIVKQWMRQSEAFVEIIIRTI